MAKQTVFILLDEYYQSILQLIQEYAFIADMTKKEFNRRLYESLICGLGEHTRTEVSKKQCKAVLYSKSASKY